MKYCKLEFKCGCLSVYMPSQEELLRRVFVLNSLGTALFCCKFNLLRNSFRTWRFRDSQVRSTVCQHIIGAVVPPYVGMARKQNGGYNASIASQSDI